MLSKKQFLITLILVLGFVQLSMANVQLPAIFGDHMVLQENSTVAIWGWGKPYEKITITCSWAPEKEYTMVVPNTSKWSIDIETPEAGGTYTIDIKGYDHVKIEDVLIGEVWLGSGQSNMEWSANMGINDADEEIKNAKFPEIRLFHVHTSTALTPQQQLLSGEWVKCTPESMQNFSALMYFFGRRLYQELDKPIGLIHSSWGGTPVEVWIPEEYVTYDRELLASNQLLEEMEWSPKEAGRAYNSMINPIAPFKIKGVLWYQGETNVGVGNTYAKALSTLATSWRAIWGDNFTFYYAQIAPWNDYGSDNTNAAELRDQQRKVAHMIDKSAMAITSDIGDLTNIHPGNKQAIGKRLADLALYYDYKKGDEANLSPVFQKATLEKSKVVLEFDHAANGLEAADGKEIDVELLAADGIWYATKAKAKGNTVIVTPNKGDMPTAVRLDFKNAIEPTLVNSSGMPASTFKADIQ